MKDRSGSRSIFQYYLHILGFAAVFAATAVIVTSTGLGMSQQDTARLADSIALQGNGLPVIIIDPGHGGEDGGAVAGDGTCEKEINLKVAEYLYCLCRSFGYECELTRDTDTMLSDGTGASRKMSDLRQRVKLTEGRDCVFVSIHQNKFPNSSVSGIQVYYSKNDPLSEKLARLIQSNASYVQKDNTRQIKKAGSEIYVLDNCTAPAVLVECGFLSNPAELALLKTENHQKKLACMIFSALTEYTAGVSEEQK